MTSASPPPSVALSRDFAAMEDFLEFAESEPQFFDPSLETQILGHCRLHGIHSLAMGYCDASQVAVVGPEAREHLLVRGLNSRQRAVIDEIELVLQARGLAAGDAKIYGHEAITPLALFLRGRFAKFIGTEYTSNQEQRDDLFPIMHGDICDSEFPDDSFHVVFSCDVLEHVPTIDDALAETARILKPDGRFIFTVPFLYQRQESARFATLQDGKVIHHIETPIYHGNPMDPHGGSLVFEIPGWDILDRARRAGFRRAMMRFVCDQDRGILASSLGEPLPAKGVFLGLFDR